MLSQDTGKTVKEMQRNQVFPVWGSAKSSEESGAVYSYTELYRYFFFLRQFHTYYIISWSKNSVRSLMTTIMILCGNRSAKTSTDAPISVPGDTPSVSGRPAVLLCITHQCHSSSSPGAPDGPGLYHCPWENLQPQIQSLSESLLHSHSPDLPHSSHPDSHGKQNLDPPAPCSSLNNWATSALQHVQHSQGGRQKPVFSLCL